MLPSSRDNPLRQLMRRFLAAIRMPIMPAARVASRLTAVSRYLFDLLLWSRIVSRQSELARHSASMRWRGVEHAAPCVFMSGCPERALIWEEGFDEVYRLLLANLQRPDLISGRRYARPSPAFEGIYLWDSAFIAQVWKAWDPGVALDCCLSVLDQAAPDGRLPHVTTHFIASPYTQPPLIAWALDRLHEWDHSAQSREALEASYKALVAYQNWLEQERRLDNGLYFWAHPYESGVENAPRFSSRDERTLLDTRHLAAPDFSAYVVLNLDAMASIALALGCHDDQQCFAQRADDLRGRINQLLWHDEDGLYYDLDTQTNSHVRSRTIASLLPLWAAVPAQGRAQRLLEHIRDPQSFGTLIPLPSVARDDPEFAKDMWRGPTWINTAYAVILGMERYGFHQDVAETAWRLVDGVYRTFGHTHRVFEFYDPERHDIAELHRKRGNHWKHLTLGDKPRGEFVGWSGLVNNLMIEHLAGYRRECGRIELRPNLPEAWVGMALALRLPGLSTSLEVESLGQGRSRGMLRIGPECYPFELDRGQVFSLPIDHPEGAP